MELSYSQAFFDLSSDSLPKSRSLKDFFRKLLALPFAFLFKISKTSFRFLGICLSGAAMVLTLGLSASIREWFLKRMIELAKDLTDWVMWPFSILAYFIKSILALFSGRFR